jgi:ADP-heptose:LPS heptosyltransferase
MGTHRIIKVCPGIGDNIWLLQKLINVNEQFDFQLPDGKPQRGKQIFDLLPQVSAKCEYTKKVKTAAVEEGNIQSCTPLWGDIKQDEFYLSANKHLEQGNRIEDFLPDLPTSFRINWDTERYELKALEMLQDKKQYIGLYGSSYKTSRTWGFWDEHKWLSLAKMVYQHNPNIVFVVIGADWDLDLGLNLIKLLEAEGMPYIKVIGEELGLVIEIMKLLTYFFSFPSGLGILAPTVGCPVTMFYPDGRNGSPDLSKMMNAWASPEDIESGQYKGCLFCEPEQIFEWVVENKKILP